NLRSFAAPYFLSSAPTSEAQVVWALPTLLSVNGATKGAAPGWNWAAGGAGRSAFLAAFFSAFFSGLAAFFFSEDWCLAFGFTNARGFVLSMLPFPMAQV